MQKRINLILSVLAISTGGTSFISQSAFAWGHLGHQTVAETASKMTTKGSQFWSANTANMGVLQSRPGCHGISHQRHV